MLYQYLVRRYPSRNTRWVIGLMIMVMAVGFICFTRQLNILTPSVYAQTVNQVQNAGFESTATPFYSPWNFQVNTGATGTINADTSTSHSGTKSTRIDVTTANATDWYIRLGQGNFTMTSGQPVQVSFWAKASASKPVTTVIQQNYSPYTTYTQRSFTIGTTWQQYSYTYTPTATDTNVKISFNFASNTASMWLDDVSFAPAATFQSGPLYWGATINGSTVGSTCGDAPWCIDGKDQSGNPATDAVTLFESHAGKQLSVMNWGGSWFRSTTWPYNNYVPFDAGLFEKVRQHGALSLYTWAPDDGDLGPNANQSNFTLSHIIQGDVYGANCNTTTNPSCKTYDAYLTEWATAAKNWGHPLFLRFAWEMNGNWYLWSEQKNGNSAGQYAQAWRHVHDIFTRVGATNVTWVWCPNVDYSGSTALEGLYPGDAYVDWTCMDGYNDGTDPGKPDTWKSFTQVFSPTYNHLLQIAPSKPIMIAETASSEYGGSKASWITDMLTTQLPGNYPAIKAFLWFDWAFQETNGVVHWEIESSQTAQNAFKSAIASSNYATNTMANLPLLQPIAPLTAVTTPTPTSISPTPTNTPTPPTPTPTPTRVPTLTPTRTPTPTPTPDIVKPSVSITAPTNGSSVTHSATTTIKASASDNIGVTKVEFYVGSTLTCTDTTSSYTCAWSVPSKTGVTYSLVAKAYDRAGNVGTSSTVKVTSR